MRGQSWEQPPYLERKGVTAYRDFFSTIEREGEKTMVLQSGMFDGSMEKYKEALNAVVDIEKRTAITMF